MSAEKWKAGSLVSPWDQRKSTWARIHFSSVTMGAGTGMSGQTGPMSGTPSPLPLTHQREVSAFSSALFFRMRKPRSTEAAVGQRWQRQRPLLAGLKLIPLRGSFPSLACLLHRPLSPCICIARVCILQVGIDDEFSFPCHCLEIKSSLKLWLRKL